MQKAFFLLQAMVEKNNNNKKNYLYCRVYQDSIEKQAVEIRSKLNLIEQLQDSAITCVLYVLYEVLTIIALYRTHVV